MLGTGSMTDPYTPIENEICNLRKALLLAHQYGFGFTLITKSDRVLRDIDLLKAIRLENILLSRFDNAVYDCAALSTPGGVREQKVFPANNKRLNRTLRPIIIYLQPAIQQEVV